MAGGLAGARAGVRLFWAQSSKPQPQWRSDGRWARGRTELDMEMRGRLIDLKASWTPVQAPWCAGEAHVTKGGLEARRRRVGSGFSSCCILAVCCRLQQCVSWLRRRRGLPSAATQPRHLRDVGVPASPAPFPSLSAGPLDTEAPCPARQTTATKSVEAVGRADVSLKAGVMDSPVLNGYAVVGGGGGVCFCCVINTVV